jgi:hypothetical protein
MPQVFGPQASTQRWFWQAFERSHSELVKHSGLQFGGELIMFGEQLHTAWPLVPSRH